MRTVIVLLATCMLLACQKNNSSGKTPESFEKDSVVLAQMILDREEAMIHKNIRAAVSQFSEDVTWINSQGYYFKGKDEVMRFHHMLAKNDSLDYYYEAGKPLIRVLDSSNALAYYSWKMYWFKKTNPADTTFKEIGLMTLNANKSEGSWKWSAVTNQHTPWFYPEITPIESEEN